MKKLSVNKNKISIDIALLIARFGIAALMLTHGIPKLMMLLSGGGSQFPALFGLTGEMALGLTVFAEVGCSIFLLLGFATRLSTIPLIITMAVAILIIHSADPFAKQEPAFQYLLVYTILFITGAGKYSLDFLLLRNRTKTTNAGDQIRQSHLAIN